MKTKPTRLETKPIVKSDGQFAVSDPQRLNKKQRLKKSCTGCGDYFTCYQSVNYDYCRSCAINGSRYAKNQCPECGDGSGIIKFPKSPPRACLLCSLKPKILKEALESQNKPGREYEKKIKDLALDLRIKILEISNLNKWTKEKDRDYNFYLKLSDLLEQAQRILDDKYYGKNEKTWPEKGLLSLLHEKNGLSRLDHNKVQANTPEGVIHA